jgi:hypothetical protein
MHDFFELIICVPLIPLFAPEAHLSEYVDKGIEDILTLNERIEISIEGVGSFKLNVFTLSDDPAMQNSFSFSNGGLIFRIVVHDGLEKMEMPQSDNTPISTEDRLLLFKKYITEEFKYQISNLLVLSNISFPGSIKTREGIVLLNKEKYDSFSSAYSIHRESLDDIRILKWPVYKNLTIYQVWLWFESNNFSFRSHSKTKVARALNAFTYLSKNSPLETFSDLFWSLIGIEALYCTSKDSISEQIYEKVQLVLGPVNESKKKVKSMYNFRSRLVHGDIDIPPNNFDYDDEDEQKFQKEMFDATILAVAILTTTLQEIVIKNGTDLNFKYVLE